MKKFNLFFKLLLLFLTISSCSKDSDNHADFGPINTGKLIVNGVEKSINKGFIIPN